MCAGIKSGRPLKSPKVYIVEDNPLHAEKLNFIADQLGYQVCGLTDNYSDALQEISAVKPDIVLLDIRIKGNKSGIDIAEKLRSTKDFPVIFLTSLKDKQTIDEVKHIEPDAYLLKPANKDALSTAIELALYRYAKKKLPVHEGEDKNRSKGPGQEIVVSDAIFIKVDNLLKKIPFEEILYVEVLKTNYCTIVTEQENYEIRTALSDLEHTLSPHNFYRIHRSILINASKMDGVNYKSNYVIINETKVPIGKTYKQGLLKSLITIS